MVYIPYVIIVNPSNDQILEQGRFFIPGSIYATKALLNKAQRKWKNQ